MSFISKCSLTSSTNILPSSHTNFQCGGYIHIVWERLLCVKTGLFFSYFGFILPKVVQISDILSTQNIKSNVQSWFCSQWLQLWSELWSELCCLLTIEPFRTTSLSTTLRTVSILRGLVVYLAILQFWLHIDLTQIQLIASISTMCSK